jgi:6-phosphogluconolactonase
MTLISCADRNSWIGIFVDEFYAAAKRAKDARRQSFQLCVAGGSTPEPIYRAYAALPDPGLAVELWLGDERAVPPGDPARNGGMVGRAFASAPWSPRLHLWPASSEEGEAGAAACAAAYAAELASALGPAPVFDLLILGLGADGHTASLFPGGEALNERARLAAVSRSPLPPKLRMTLTYPALSGARRTLFAVGGGEKRDIVGKLAAEDPALPASTAGGEDREIVYLDA